MKEVELMEVPYKEGDDAVTFRDGMCVRLDEGSEYVTLFIGHETRTVTETAVDIDGNETVTETDKVYAFPIRVEKPLTRAKAINAAEKAAYHLLDAEAVASFNASLARKSRVGEDTDEVSDHDDLIEWVKEGLDSIGL